MSGYKKLQDIPCPLAANELAAGGGAEIRSIRDGVAGGNFVRGSWRLLVVVAALAPCSATRRRPTFFYSRLVLLAGTCFRSVHFLYNHTTPPSNIALIHQFSN